MDIPKMRAPNVAFGGVPRFWFADSRAATNVANAVNLLFPAGERFFIRSVRHYLPQLSAERAAQVRGFFAQEGKHAHAHEQLFDTMRAQGYEIDSILRRYERVAYDGIEKATSPRMRLAVTAALEHFTAIMAEDALSSKELSHADPEVRHLLEWHAVEELEHKAVAFDVLSEVAPSYPLRVMGMILATLTLGGFWVFALRELLAQDGSTIREALRELEDLRKRGKKGGQFLGREPVVKRIFAHGFRAYMRRDFHPNDVDHAPLIAATLKRLAEEGMIAEPVRPATAA